MFYRGGVFVTFLTRVMPSPLNLSPEGAFTPDANDVNKSRCSREVGHLNILSLLASFAPFSHEIHYTTDANLRHGRGFCQAVPVWLQNVFLFL